MVQLAKAANTPENKEQMGDFTPVPAGKYPAMIIKSQYKETKAKTGHYLQFDIKITQGEHAGRLLFERLNLDNPNPVAVEIANKTLNTISHACGKIGVMDSDELHGIEMLLTVIKNEATETQPANNDIKFYEPAGNAPIVPQQLATNTQAPPAAAQPVPEQAQNTAQVGGAIAQGQTPPAAAPAGQAAPAKLPWEK